MQLLAFFIARLAEPSTYACLATLLGLAGVNLAPAELQAVIAVLTAVAAALAVFLPELSAQAVPPLPNPAPPTSKLPTG